MTEQEQKASKRSQSIRERIHIFGYVLAFIFLFIEGGRLSNVLIQVVGVLFLVPALLILIGQFRVAKLKRIANFADDISTFPMYLATITLFIKEIFSLVNFTQQVELIWVIPVVLLAIIVYDIIEIVKHTKAMAVSIGNKVAASRQLKILTYVIIYFLILVLAFNVQGIGNLIFWLIPAFISLVIALYLDGTLKR